MRLGTPYPLPPIHTPPPPPPRSTVGSYELRPAVCPSVRHLPTFLRMGSSVFLILRMVFAWSIVGKK